MALISRAAGPVHHTFTPRDLVVRDAGPPTGSAIVKAMLADQPYGVNARGPGAAYSKVDGRVGVADGIPWAAVRS